MYIAPLLHMQGLKGWKSSNVRVDADTADHICAGYTGGAHCGCRYDR